MQKIFGLMTNYSILLSAATTSPPPPFDPAQWDFQYLDEDEWGWYFTLLRINWTHNNLLFVKQDTVSRHYSFHQLNLTDAKMDTIAAILAPITTNNQTFPIQPDTWSTVVMCRLFYKYADTLHLRYWQHNQQLPQRPQREIATIIDLLETVLIVDLFRMIAGPPDVKILLQIVVGMFN